MKDDRKLNIGLLGLDFSSGNLGCQALGYGFYILLNEALKRCGASASITCFSPVDKTRCQEGYGLDFDAIQEKRLCGNRTRQQRKDQRSLFSTFDIIFDFTAGDSFSDIYGIKRFISNSLEKENVIKSGTILILGNQTYGPFKSPFARAWAKHIVRNSLISFTRDHMSASLVREFGVEPYETIDVAFALPYRTNVISSNKIKIGFNPSGLLWNGGYNGKNQFGLKTDYIEYCSDVLKKLLESNAYEIHLIGHVLSGNLQSNDNDLHAIHALQRMFPSLVSAPFFRNPIEAKSYISGMDVFVGARMHATIGAYSSGVPTIPFAYSRKFAGVFSDLQYDYVVDGMSLTTKEAVDKTLTFIHSSTDLKSAMTVGNNYIQVKKNDYLNKLVEVINDSLTEQIYE